MCLSPVSVRFAAEFDFRTFDPEGVVLYAESSQDSWFMLGLRDGRIEVQFKNQHTFKVTSGGKAINDGQWHVVRKSNYFPTSSVKPPVADKVIANVLIDIQNQC